MLILPAGHRCLIHVECTSVEFRKEVWGYGTVLERKKFALFLASRKVLFIVLVNTFNINLLPVHVWSSLVLATKQNKTKRLSS